MYMEELKARNVTDVVRVCEPTYNKAVLETQAGIKVTDIPFPDGSIPPASIIQAFLSICDDRFPGGILGVASAPAESNPQTPAIGVHCVAGLGRAPVLVTAALIEAGMTPLDAIDFVRRRRRGAFNSVQLTYLVDSYRKMWKKSMSTNSLSMGLGVSNAGGNASSGIGGMGGRIAGFWGGKKSVNGGGNKENGHAAQQHQHQHQHQDVAAAPGSPVMSENGNGNGNGIVRPSSPTLSKEGKENGHGGVSSFGSLLKLRTKKSTSVLGASAVTVTASTTNANGASTHATHASDDGDEMKDHLNVHQVSSRVSSGTPSPKLSSKGSKDSFGSNSNPGPIGHVNGGAVAASAAASVNGSGKGLTLKESFSKVFGFGHRKSSSSLNGGGVI
jgi:protein-tyrosine phosphatase